MPFQAGNLIIGKKLERETNNSSGVESVRNLSLSNLRSNLKKDENLNSVGPEKTKKKSTFQMDMLSLDD